MVIYHLPWCRAGSCMFQTYIRHFLSPYRSDSPMSWSQGQRCSLHLKTFPISLWVSVGNAWVISGVSQALWVRCEWMTFHADTSTRRCKSVHGSSAKKSLFWKLAAASTPVLTSKEYAVGFFDLTLLIVDSLSRARFSRNLIFAFLLFNIRLYCNSILVFPAIQHSSFCNSILVFPAMLVGGNPALWWFFEWSLVTFSDLASGWVGIGECVYNFCFMVIYSLRRCRAGCTNVVLTWMWMNDPNM